MPPITTQLFEKILHGGEVKVIDENEYFFLNNQENFHLRFDVELDKVKEISHTNLSLSQLKQIEDRIYEFDETLKGPESLADQRENDVMDHGEQFKTFY